MGAAGHDDRLRVHLPDRVDRLHERVGLAGEDLDPEQVVAPFPDGFAEPGDGGEAVRSQLEIDRVSLLAEAGREVPQA